MTMTYSPPPDAPPKIVHADDALLVADKPTGLLSVPGRGADKMDCLVSRVHRDFPDALVVHRLDMSTSGLLLLARSKAMQSHLSQMFRERQVEKRYIAVVAGLVREDAGEIELPLVCDWPNRPRQKVDFTIGKHSLTRYCVISRDIASATTRVMLTPVTGRSHQLRVHLATLGHAILGDDLYGDRMHERAERLLLHATELAFIHPSTATAVRFASAPPF
jgi:tRNA pseudouridine32 synthase/23S rRNA pseudouridine746 synthase